MYYFKVHIRSIRSPEQSNQNQVTIFKTYRVTMQSGLARPPGHTLWDQITTEYVQSVHPVLIVN